MNRPCLYLRLVHSPIARSARHLRLSALGVRRGQAADVALGDDPTRRRTPAPPSEVHEPDQTSRRHAPLSSCVLVAAIGGRDRVEHQPPESPHPPESHSYHRPGATLDAGDLSAISRNEYSNAAIRSDPPRPVDAATSVTHATPQPDDPGEGLPLRPRSTGRNSREAPGLLECSAPEENARAVQPAANAPPEERPFVMPRPTQLAISPPLE